MRWEAWFILLLVAANIAVIANKCVRADQASVRVSCLLALGLDVVTIVCVLRLAGGA